ncbi:MAG TPA: leucine-rich repeat domain-containing protein, partial [Candidatus Acidoferrales bacterium]|nr:leucine-rich repeat domain-containing protein [Candidatus Acidoferrales bacterium]
IPGSVTNIGGLAFDGCGATNVITIGSGLISIGFAALNDCFRLSGFTADPQNPFYSSLSGVLFDKNQTTLIAFPGGVGGNYAIPGTVTNIGPGAFSNATNLTNVTVPNSVMSIDTNAFFSCFGLTSIPIPDSVTNIEFQAFSACWYLASVTIGSNVTSIGPRAFQYCDDLQSIYFRGNAPVTDSTAFSGDTNAIAYYLLGTTGWSVFAANTGVPVTLWLPQIQTGASGFGVQTNQFDFSINWTSGQTITIEACTNLFSPDWQPLQTNTLAANSLYFSDPQVTNYPTRFYRILSP